MSRNCEQIKDLENQIETWKALQRANMAKIGLMQELHEKDQQCLILFAKRLNKVTAENVELKRKVHDYQDMLIEQIAEEVKQNQYKQEYAEMREIMRALKDVE